MLGLVCAKEKVKYERNDSHDKTGTSNKGGLGGGGCVRVCECVPVLQKDGNSEESGQKIR